MIDLLFQIGLSNAIIALLLAMIALVVEKTARWPMIAHLLWLLVFIKLLTPAFMPIPLDFLPAYFHNPAPVMMDAQLGQYAISGLPELAAQEPAFSVWASIAAALRIALPWLAGLWLLGSLFVLMRSLWHVYRFHKALRAVSKSAPPALIAIAEGIGERFGLKTLPEIIVTSASISPMVWWVGRRVRIALPAALVDELDQEKIRWILAHELAHVRRLDHVVRWVEWLACVCFWWNPLVWWARQHLRANEELCCDALVLESLRPAPQTYAESLLTAIECLACPVIRPPAVASEINSGGILERRLKMIVSKTPKLKISYWMLGIVLLSALIILPISFATRGDANAAPAAVAVNPIGDASLSINALLDTDEQTEEAEESNRELIERRLAEAVESGEMTSEEADRRLAFCESIDYRISQPIDIEAIKAELELAVEKGEITREAADRKLECCIKLKNQDCVPPSIEEIRACLEEAVRNGEITREEAEKRIQFCESIQGQACAEIDLEAVRAEVQAAVESGDLTQQEAEQALKELQQRIENSRFPAADCGAECRRSCAECDVDCEHGCAGS